MADALKKDQSVDSFVGVVLQYSQVTEYIKKKIMNGLGWWVDDCTTRQPI